MTNQEIHVVPDGEGWWAIDTGTERLRFPTKHLAIDEARKMAAESNMELVIHGSFGQILGGPVDPPSYDQEEMHKLIRKLSEERYEKAKQLVERKAAEAARVQTWQSERARNGAATL